MDQPLVLDDLEKYSALRNNFNSNILLGTSHVGIRGNELADEAAKAALNERPIIMTLPCSDFKPLVKRLIIGKWSVFNPSCPEIKLHSAQPTLGCGSLSNRERRREQLVLCRLRLGHTHIAHRYLLAGEDPPVCLVSGKFESGTHPDPLCSSMSDTNVLMSVPWENCFIQFIPM